MMRPHRAFALVLAAYFILTIAYGIMNPLFEAPDEHWHFFTAQYIATHAQLPFVAEDYDEWLSQEAAQPPLYYVLGALLIAPIDTSQARQQVWPNPLQSIGDASALANSNRFIHTAQEGWPWQGYVLAAHLLRLFSTLLGAGTLVCIYGAGRQLWPEMPNIALLAVGLVAFLPQFNFVHASVTNDALIVFLASLALWQMIRLWTTAVAPSPRALLFLGLTIGLAALSKNTGIALLAYAIATMGWLTLRPNPRANWRLLPRTLFWLITPTLLLAGWLWVRNWQLYGDWTAVNQFIRLADGDRHFTLWQVLGESNGLWLSLFGVFGWFNLRAPVWFYWLYTLLVLLAFGGYFYQLRSKPFHFPPLSTFHFPFSTELWLAGWVFLVYAALLSFMLRTPAAQGRLLFPALLPLALALANGLSHLPLPSFGPLSTIHFPLFTFFLPCPSIFILFFTIRPAYALPPQLTAVPIHAMPLHTTFDDGLQLLGVDWEETAVQPGQLVWLTLYWQASRPLSGEPPRVVVELFGRNLTRLAQLDSYHGRGLYPATLWPAGQIVADRVALRVDEEATAPVLARAFVHLTDSANEGTAVGTLKITPATWPPAQPVVANVGAWAKITAVTLSPNQAQAGQTLTVHVQWQVQQTPTTDLTTFVHLGPADQPPLATGDSPPLQGDYPTTAWASGEIINDSYTLTLPPNVANGRYPIWLGLYDPATGQRQPILVAGQPQTNDAFLVGEIEVK